ncbi:MAG TPA: DegT/DnrJ/EryC1/StrS family aminotransferase [Xanthobacteraceae bacterium]|nr:DegT/DnrJ/EryC1/StrS family aminotransferase [Xanthobacteraceae bacterium]
MSPANAVSAPTARRIPQVDIFVGEEEADKVSESILRRWLTEGPNAQKLAEEIRTYAKTKHLAFAPNGTLGLFLGLLALDLPRGSEILIPSFTFYGSATAAVFAGLKPVFVDSRADTYNIDIEDLERRITPNTSAIMPVHIYGQICDMDGVMDVANRHGLQVIEDAAQAFGVHFNGKHAGTFGDVGVFSFFSDKSITMGEGAALFVQDDALFERLKLLRNQGRPSSGTFIHPELGMNFRITDLQAGIGLTQFTKLARVRARRLELWRLYAEELEGVGDIRIMQIHPGSELIPFRVPVTTARKAELEVFLKENNIETRGFFYPMHLQPKLRSEPPVSLPVSEKLSQTGLCLPVHHHISDDDVRHVCHVIRTFFERL